MTADPDTQKNIFELLRSSDGPLTAKQIAQKACGSTSHKNIETIGAIVGELISQGTVFDFPPERSGYGERFWYVNPTDWLAERIVTIVKEAGGRLTLPQVRESLRKWEVPYFDGALGKLISDKKLFYLTVRFKYVLSSPPDPYDYLLPKHVTALREILERINRHRKNALNIEVLQTFLNGPSLAEILPTQASGIPSEDLLREWYHKDLPKRGGLSSIPIPLTWNHYESWCKSNNAKPDVEQFQEFMRDLHRAGKIEFISHSMTQSLSERESELSLRGSHGEVLYYWKWR
jgi:hypothetical protein